MHHRPLCFYAAIGLAPFALFSQSLEWAVPVSGPQQEIAFAVTVDAAGSVITVGSFTLTVDLDPGAGVNNVTSNGSSDIYIQKLNPIGQFEWGRSLGAGGADQGLGVTTDTQGNVIVTGKVSGTVDLDPGAGTNTVTSANTTFDVLLLKLDPNGTFLWGHIFGGNSNDVGTSVAVDAAGNIPTTGSIGTTSDLDPGPGVFSTGGNGSNDIFVQKVDASGVFLWGAAVGGSGEDNGLGIDLSTTGEIHVTGEFRNTVDFDPGAGTSPLTSLGAQDVFAWKLSAAGVLVWAKRAGGTGLERARSVAVDATGATVYTGVITSSSDMDPGAGVFTLAGSFSEPAYLWKLDANGDLQWAFLLPGFICEGRAVRVDAVGAVYATGFFGSTMDIDPSANTANLVSNGGGDAYLLGYTAAGVLLFGNTIGSAQNDIGHALAIGPGGTMHLAGEFRQTIDMDPGPNTSLLIPAGGQDAFTAKYSKPECIGVKVTLKAILEGAHTPADFLPMSDLLRSQGFIPLQEPYSAMGFALDEPASTTPLVLTWTLSSAIVDWVVVELRDAVLNDSVVGRRAALLRRDGEVVAEDGVSPVAFCQPVGSYHVALRHRNHLGVMTALPIALSSMATNVDLTLASTPTFGIEARHDVGTAHVLWQGNALFDDVIKYTGGNNDRDPILQRIGGVSPTATLPGYWPEDVTLDGLVKYTGAGNDRDRLLLTIGGSVPTNTRSEQLP
ncbi:MAG: hypothetical protein IPN38_03925 [Flavobacteriales bacterium]|nr:hypothetical protein [Flavobacteriales bacterium]